jgi:hypothetical protein
MIFARGTIALPRCSPSQLDVLRLFLIDVRQGVAGRLVGMEQFVKLGMDGLRIAMRGALDEERHDKRRNGRDRVPFEGARRGDDSQGPIERYRKEGQRIGSEDAESRQAVPYKVHHRFLLGPTGGRLVTTVENPLTV